MPHPRLRYALAVFLALMAAPVSSQQPTVERVAYAVRHRPPADVVAVFRPLVERAPGVELRIDDAANRIVLKGPVWTHELLETVLDRMDRPRAVEKAGNAAPNPTDRDDGSPLARLSPPTTSAPPRSQPNRIRRSPNPATETDRVAAADSPGSTGSTGRSTEPTRRLYALPRGRAASIRNELRRRFDDRSQGSADDADPWTIATRSGRLKIDFDLAREDVLVDGPANSVEDFSRMLAAISRDDSSPDGTRERIVNVTRDARPHVEALLRASRRATDMIAAKPIAQRPAQIRTAPVRPGSERIASRPGTPFRFAAAQPPTGDGAGSDEAPSGAPDDEAGTTDDAPEGSSPLPQLDGIEIESLPELDAIILRGRDRDVEDLAEIIRQLEALSRETRPAIEIVPLQHSQSGRIAEVIEESQESLLGSRQGRAQVLPLGKPNAMLLIGWGDAVAALKELIRKLDQQVEPETQFNVFRLKYATAEELQQTVTEFFDDRPEGMEPTIQSTVDGRTNSLVVHAAPRDMAEVARLIERLDSPESRRVQRTRVFPIRNSIAADLAETLEQAIESPNGDVRGTMMELMIDDPMRRELVVSGILENIRVTVDPRKNSLIISAPAENFELIEALIRQLDSEGATAKIKIFPIENGDAGSLVETLRALLPSQEGGDTPIAQVSSAPGDSSLVPLRFTVDVRSNSVIASGSEGDLKIVDALIARLDESDTMQRKNMVYQLKNSPAVDVALAINEFLRNTRQVESATPGAANPFQQLEKEVVVVPEPVSNKLVLSATPRYFTEIEGLIEKLDEQPPQVMIQVVIAEVSLGNAEEFGIELGVQDSVLFDRSLLGELVTLTQTTQTSTQAGILTETDQLIIGAENTPGFDFNGPILGNSGSEQAINGASNVGGQGLSNFSVGRTNAELGFGGLVLSASSQNVSVLLRALEESRRMQVLSRPQILTLDNQPAFIQVGQRVPRIIGSSINQIGQQNEIALENVGLILGVTPRISPEGNVVMEIDAEKSAIGPESEGIPVSVSADGTTIRSPRIDVASAQATVSAADGETIILGGLITTSEEEIHRKVPVLGDIPILRNLFRFDSMIDRRNELLIILTPRVIRNAPDAERLKQIETARMSWCAADVFDLHGEYLENPEFAELVEEEGPWDVIYPHVDPRGQTLGEGRMMQGDHPPSVLDSLEPVPLNESGENLPGVDRSGMDRPGEVLPGEVRLDSGETLPLGEPTPSPRGEPNGPASQRGNRR